MIGGDPHPQTIKESILATLVKGRHRPTGYTVGRICWFSGRMLTIHACGLVSIPRRHRYLQILLKVRCCNRFDIPRTATWVAQLVECQAQNLTVQGSSPGSGVYIFLFFLPISEHKILQLGTSFKVLNYTGGHLYGRSPQRSGQCVGLLIQRAQIRPPDGMIIFILSAVSSR